MTSDSGSDHFFYNGSANGSGPMHGATVNGVYFEFYGNNVNLVKAGTTNATQRNLYRFSACDFHAVSTVTSNLTNWVTIQTATWVLFNGCTFIEDSTGGFYFTVTGTTTPYGENGVIRFDRCMIPIDWSDRCTISNRGGIHASGCFGSNVGSPATGSHWAHDFDLGWDEANVGHTQDGRLGFDPDRHRQSDECRGAAEVGLPQIGPRQLADQRGVDALPSARRDHQEHPPPQTGGKRGYGRHHDGRRPQ